MDSAHLIFLRISGIFATYKYFNAHYFLLLILLCFFAYLSVQGPPAPAPFSSTNHLGRQRPPPQPDAKSPERRPVSASPYSSPYRKRKAASITDRSGGGAAAGGSGSGTAGSFAPGGTNNGNNNGGGSGRGSSSGSVAPGEDLASVTSFPEQFRFLGELDRQSNSKSYQEFKQWLATNRDWMRKCERKVGMISCFLFSSSFFFEAAACFCFQVLYILHDKHCFFNPAIFAPP